MGPAGVAGVHRRCAVMARSRAWDQGRRANAPTGLGGHSGGGVAAPLSDALESLADTVIDSRELAEILVTIFAIRWHRVVG
jgi:hypothetical protein